ncbi:hypothetical protein CEUSTIGMA_g13000.t1 [Chlamydomonas eustigma]|uniref:HMG box domain-containing protein n=1 Tax=Chlamydomonas eustigma TaxID=1157962 RepID=A0A250XRA8_9CHLO|nr:hypothetical protein CEUSTIGMA_g13000.t1 [Chlamydomonas eustigma]|eukprot:GAX85585.1 hypothetical protein CEUSTIGMA_g13000.t1 [Chlamydomonas eustigma]
MGRQKAKASDGVDKVRVWWEPTDNKSKDGFAGAYWPAIVIEKNRNKLRVRYDNGDEEDVHVDHVSEFESLPFDFGEEADLRPGEFCEVSNGSKTDPCAWFGRVVRQAVAGSYIVEYPFHNAEPEKVLPSLIRRARVLEDGQWHLVKPHQMWEDGEVSSPKELELIHEEDLEDAYKEAQNHEQLHPEKVEKARLRRKKRRARADIDDDDDDEVLEQEEEKKEEEEEAIMEASERGGRAKSKKRGRPFKVMPPPEESPPEPSGIILQQPVQSSAAPAEAVCLFVTVEPWHRGGICYVPTKDNLPITGAMQIFVPVRSSRAAAAKPQSQGKTPVGNTDATLQPSATPNLSPLQGLVAANNAALETAPPSALPASQPPLSNKLQQAALPLSQAPLATQVHNVAAMLNASAVNAVGKQAMGAASSAAAAAAEVNTGGIYYKEKTAKKGAPKKAKTPWNVFVEMNRRNVIANNPGKDNNEVNQILGSQWRSLSAEEKANYEEKAEKDRGRYMSQLVAQGQSELLGKRIQAAVESGVSARPTQPRDALQLYSIEFMKALNISSAGAGVVESPAATDAAVQAWNNADDVVKSRYRDKQEADKLRYEREYQAWLTAQEDLDEVLNKGVDLKKVKRRLADLGFKHEAYISFVDVWRKDSPRVHDAIQAYKMHVVDHARPDWQAVLVTLFGLSKVEAMRKPPKDAATAHLNHLNPNDHVHVT